VVGALIEAVAWLWRHGSNSMDAPSLSRGRHRCSIDVVSGGEADRSAELAGRVRLTEMIVDASTDAEKAGRQLHPIADWTI
jgi:hypothetical protein